MKKVVVASLLACGVMAWGGVSTLNAQAAPASAAPAQAAPAAAAACQLPEDQYKAYTDATNQTTPQAKAQALEAFLTAFPQNCAKEDALNALMNAYVAANDVPKALDTADRILQIDPQHLLALTYETFLRKQSADALTDPAAKQAALDTAATYAQKLLTELTGTKPAKFSDADFNKAKAAGLPLAYGVIGADDMGKKDFAGAIDAYTKELASVPVAQTAQPGPQLQDTYYLGLAYMQATPPDYLNCAYYTIRFVTLAPEPYKTQFAPTAKYCYRKYHGADDGYDAVAQVAQANLNPPAGFKDTVKPAPTPADIVNQVIASTPDLGTLAVGDKEFILQNGTPDQAQKVWDTIKGKSVEIPGALVIASTPTQLQVAISDDAVQSKTADFTFNLKPLEDLPEHATAAQKAAYKKKQDAIAAATAVGQTVTLDGTYDSYTPKPIMITMSDGVVVLPKAATKSPAHAPVHRPSTRK